MKKIILRLLKDNDDDYSLLEKWYQEEEIYSSFEQRKLSFDEIKKKYYPRTLENSMVPVYMIEYDKVPIGIIQYKLLDKNDKKLYKLEDKNIYELDIFIGRLDMHNKGIGSNAIKQMMNFLIKNKEADMLVMCPLKSNIKAINCYKKCGFNIINSFRTEDTIGKIQDYILMVYK